MKPITQWTGADMVAFAKTVDKKTWIQIGVSTAVVLLLVYLFVWPAWFKRAKVHAEIKSVEGQIIRVETLRRNQKGWEQNKRDYISFSESVKKRLYEPGEASLLLGEISELAVKSGVDIIASKPRDEAEQFPEPFDQQYEADIYDFTLEGGFHELADFAGQIESYPKVLRIQNFRIVPREDSPDKHLAEVAISAVSFKKEDAAAEVQG